MMYMLVLRRSLVRAERFWLSFASSKTCCETGLVRPLSAIQQPTSGNVIKIFFQYSNISTIYASDVGKIALEVENNHALSGA